MAENNSVIWTKLDEKLQEMKFMCTYDAYIYILNNTNMSIKPPVSFVKLKSVIQKYHYDDFIALKSIEKSLRKDSETADVECLDNFRDSFKTDLPNYDQRFYKLECVPTTTFFDFSEDVFFSFALLSLPLDINGIASQEIIKAIEFFKSEEIFNHFIYGACWKFYVGTPRPPKKIKKIFDNTLSVERYMKNSEKW